MRYEVKSFMLRTAVVALVLGAMCFVGAYGTGKWCVEMLVSPACIALAYGAYQTEKGLRRAALRPALRVTAKQPKPMRVA